MSNEIPAFAKKSAKCTAAPPEMTKAAVPEEILGKTRRLVFQITAPENLASWTSTNEAAKSTARKATMNFCLPLSISGNPLYSASVEKEGGHDRGKIDLADYL